MEIKYDVANGGPIKLHMRKPADMHQHLRQSAMMEMIVPRVAKRFAMAIVMPNTVLPITTVKMAEDYRCEIDMINGPDFLPLMTFYLTDTLDPKEVERALKEDLIVGIKYYPPGLTTNSDSGVSDPAELWTPGTKPYQCLRVLAEHNGVFLIHAADGRTSAAWEREGRRTYRAGEELDPFDQEPHFICESLPQIIDAHPNLKISVEHLSTAVGAQFIRKNGNAKLGCSLTAHHLLLDRRDLFRKGFNVHRSWMPVIQPKEHKDELRKLAAEDKPFVWLGSDSAPHPRVKKEAPCCASGVLMAHAGIELYVEAFEDMGCLNDKFERFASINGPRFYGLEPSEETITLVRKEWKVEPIFTAEPWSPGPDAPPIEEVVPFRLGETVRWKLVE